ncbi:MAG: Zn-ribbon domain-containing OB-fold protein [Candidatus ainarchaeum sp.]|nr:Zn-ribbon domain-containing OB-fold protein [Candidatus ainarchaeum sp.]
MRESIPLTWRRIPERYRMKGNKCLTCSTTYFPPRTICPKCRRKGKLEFLNFKGTGKIYTFTEIHSPASGFEEQVPYIFAIVELDEGAHITGQVVDAHGNDVKIGDRVEAVFRKIQSDDPEGLIHYGFKFRLVK